MLLAFLLLGEMETALTYACLLPIVGGVALASMGDMAFSSLAFSVVQVSNLGFSGRAVFVKQLKSAHKGSASAKDDVELFLNVHVLGLVFLLPAVATELPALWAVATPELLFKLGGTMAINGVFYTTYNLFSFLVLSRVSPDKHSPRSHSVPHTVLISRCGAGLGVRARRAQRLSPRGRHHRHHSVLCDADGHAEHRRRGGRDRGCAALHVEQESAGAC